MKAKSNARIAFRACQGVGGSGLYSLAQICLVEFSPGGPEVIGALIGVTLAISYVLGPILGGIFSTYLSWRAIFWIKYVSSCLPLVGSNISQVSRLAFSRCSVSFSCGNRPNPLGGPCRKSSQRSTSWEFSCSSWGLACWFLVFKRPDLACGTGPHPSSSPPL